MTRPELASAAAIPLATTDFSCGSFVEDLTCRRNARKLAAVNILHNKPNLRALDHSAGVRVLHSNGWATII
jgi:hypothetical protein